MGSDASLTRLSDVSPHTGFLGFPAPSGSAMLYNPTSGLQTPSDSGDFSRLLEPEMRHPDILLAVANVSLATLTTQATYLSLVDQQGSGSNARGTRGFDTPGWPCLETPSKLHFIVSCIFRFRA